MHTYSHSCCFGIQFSGVFIAASAAKRFLLLPLLVTDETASESRARDFIRQQESLALMVNVNVNVNVVCMDRVAFST